MLSRLYYVCCDRCGIPESEGHMSAVEAHLSAKRGGWKRIPRMVEPGESGWGVQVVEPAKDICPPCAALEVKS